MLRLIDPDDVGWWSEFQLGCFLLINKNPNPPEAVIFRWEYTPDGGDIRNTYHEGSIDFMDFSKYATIWFHISRNSRSGESIKAKLNVVMLDPFTDELQYQINSEEFEVDPRTVESQGVVILKASEIKAGRYSLWIYLIDSEDGYRYDKIGPIDCTVASKTWYTPILDFFDKIVTFFSETIPDFFRDLVSKEESVEEKAIRNVERELDMISKGTDFISELQKSIYELSEEEIPEEYLQFEFTYTIQGARFFTNVDEARNYMNSMGISSYDMNDALSIVTELELDQLGFCIVVVDYYLNIAGDAEEGRYPVVCDEEGTPFWESWHLYEDIQEMYEEIEQESYGAEYCEAEQLVLENQDLKGTRLRICIRNPGAVDAVIVAVYRNGTFIATIDKPLRRNSTTCFELPGTYYLGDSVTLVTEEGTQIKFKVK